MHGVSYQADRSLSRNVSIVILPLLAIGQQGQYQERSSAEVLIVVDGDTVVLDLQGQQVTCRLIGIDTPETVHPSRPVEAYGREASSFLTNLLKGETVWVDQESANLQDHYGRSLVYIFRQPDGLFVNQEIVRQGYGHVYTAEPFRYMEQFRAYEQKAREVGKGLWAAEDQLAPTESQVGDDPIVFGTNTGSKYHRDGCRSLTLSKIPMKLSAAKSRGLSACGICYQ